MSVQHDIVYTITGPDGTVATINGDPLAATYVGIIDTEAGLGGFDSAEVREGGEDLPEGDGGLQGPSFYGRRPYSIPVIFLPDPGANLNARIDRLNRATNAMQDDPVNGIVSGFGTVAWTETGREETYFPFRRQVPYRVTGGRPKKALIGVISPWAYPLGSAETPRTITTNTNVPASGVLLGTVPTFPKFVLTAPQNTITLTRNSPAGTPAAVMTLTGLLGAGTVTVDFAAKTVTATIGAANRIGAVVFPTSEWWKLVPGFVNQVSVSGATATNGLLYRNAYL